MQYYTVLALASVANASPFLFARQGLPVTERVSPTAAAPPGCTSAYSGSFGIAVQRTNETSSTRGEGASQVADGQPQAPSMAVSMIPDGQLQAGATHSVMMPVVSQIADGQLQAPNGDAVSQIADGQPQAPAGGAVSQIADGQPQAPTGAVSQLADGQPQAPSGGVSQIADGQPQAPSGGVSQIADGQPQAPAGGAVNQIADGQPQAPAGGVSQIADGQPQAPTAGVSQIADGQPQNSDSASQAADGQTTAGGTTANTCSNGGLSVTLADGVLKDQDGRTGYIASNFQFQFDNPPQAGAIFTAGFTACENGTLALGGSNVFYQCLSGDFYNLYDRSWAEQCEPVFFQVSPSCSSPA